ncbi:MAG: MotA/TolQ/ExbB proton channel family protein [Saccharospirillum sp.]|nr:MotA/TolQ/ExbB proton channel family protein [Saccharospirillum sp.]
MLAFLGLLVVWFALFSGLLLDGGQLGSLTNWHAAAVVLGGTFAAGLIQSDRQSWYFAWRYFPQIFLKPGWQSGQTEAKLVRWCQLARKNGLLSLESESSQEADPFLRLGLQSLVDGEPTPRVRHNLEVAIGARERRWMKAVNLFSSLGYYAPAMGVIGAALGLIEILTQQHSMEAIVSGLALAFIALIYGLGLAALVFLPVAERLKALAFARSDFETMALDGFLAIAEGENPRVVARRLKDYGL